MTASRPGYFEPGDDTTLELVQRDDSPGGNGEIHARCVSRAILWRFRALQAKLGNSPEA